jgi:type IX secretion system PorP/SprF family membrane protein
MKKLLVFTAVITMCFGAMSQYLPQVSHFMYDETRTNPGSAGSLDMINVNGIYRNQMMGFPGRPESYFFNADAPFNLLGLKHGVGVSLNSDKLGLNSDVIFSLDYALRLSIGDGSLGIGINFGLIQSSIAYEGFITSDGLQPGAGDPYIPQMDKPDKMPFTLGVGLFYRTEEIYFGISTLNLNNPEVSTSAESGNSVSTYNLMRQYYVTSGYNMQLSNPAWELKPAVLLKSDAVVTDLDLNLTCVYNKKISGGVTYRTGEAVIGMFGLQLMEGLKLGISYDMQTTALATESVGGFEIMVNYSFKIGVEKAPQKYKSIRFL